MKIPWAIPDIGLDELAAVQPLFETNWLSQGPKVKEFEAAMAGYFRRRHAIAVSNGTIALDIALRVLGVQPGDGVVVPAMTYIATGSMVLNRGAVPQFADIDRRRLTVDPAAVRAAITDKTKCVVTMDYGGNASDYGEIGEFCRARGLPLLVDAAQSLGGTHRGRPLAAFGDLATMSFHSAKLMTTVEGGMILTDSDEHDRVCRILRNQGEDPQEKYKHIMLGYNARMMDLQAAIGLVQFAKLPGYIRRRREIAARYNAAFGRNPKITLITVRPDDEMAWFLYPVIVEDRDAVNRRINAAGIDTRFCYHLPLYRQPLFAAHAAGAHCPNAEWVGDRVINLPVYSGLNDEQVEYIIASVQASVG